MTHVSKGLCLQWSKSLTFPMHLIYPSALTVLYIPLQFQNKIGSFVGLNGYLIVVFKDKSMLKKFTILIVYYKCY